VKYVLLVPLPGRTRPLSELKQANLLFPIKGSQNRSSSQTKTIFMVVSLLKISLFFEAFYINNDFWSIGNACHFIF